jgi:hypothetical protein
MVRVSRPRAAAFPLKAPAFRLEVAASLPMVRAMPMESPLKAEVFLLMVRASRWRAPAPGQQEEAKVSQPTAPVPPELVSQPTAPVLTVPAQALAFQQMVPALVPRGLVSQPMAPVPPEQELPPASFQARHRARQAVAAGCRSSSAGRQ